MVVSCTQEGNWLKGGERVRFLSWAQGSMILLATTAVFKLFWDLCPAHHVPRGSTSSHSRKHQFWLLEPESSNMEYTEPLGYTAPQTPQVLCLSVQASFLSELKTTQKDKACIWGGRPTQRGMLEIVTLKSSGCDYGLVRVVICSWENDMGTYMVAVIMYTKAHRLSIWRLWLPRP